MKVKIVGKEPGGSMILSLINSSQSFRWNLILSERPPGHIDPTEDDLDTGRDILSYYFESTFKLVAVSKKLQRLHFCIF